MIPLNIFIPQSRAGFGDHVQLQLRQLIDRAHIKGFWGAVAGVNKIVLTGFLVRVDGGNFINPSLFIRSMAIRHDISLIFSSGFNH